MILLIHEARKASYQWDCFESQLAKKALTKFHSSLQKKA